MRFEIASLVLASALGSTAANADLEPWNDYTISDAVWSVTTINVHAAM